MMAADMAEIVGVVRLDLQGDSNPTNDTLVSGVAVSLFRDGGNGAFDGGAGDDVVAKSATSTDIFGQYRFTGVGAGKYYVKVDLPSDLQSKPGENVREIAVSAAEADGTVGFVIDGFSTMQRVEAAPPLPSSDPSSLLDNAVLGGERDLFVELTAGTDIFSSVSLTSGGGLMRLASGTTVTGNAKLVWDGVDGSASIHATGLGGVDFTRHNGNTMTGVLLAVGADHPNSVVKLRVYSDANHWSEFTTTVPETPGGAATKQVTFDFNAVPSASSGGGADFASVGAVELTFEGVSAVDGQVSVIGLVGLATKTADFTVYNRLSLGDKVWNDANNDAVLNAGEQGIAGVKVNVFADADGNNQFTAGIDPLVATATTDASGRYLIANLFPGNYIVQVDALNFQAGQALAGLQSSTGAAIDPDNNIDNDDNGSALAGHGVVSHAVGLAGLSEPTSDGDDANSNRTVDFGFFGFDLVLDKSVDLTAASPLETITYSVLIINDGPSTAKNVQFEDILPSGVTFKSVAASKAGITLVHNNGLITGSLGNMAADDQIIITIRAEVNSNASGRLINDAVVNAADEVNLSNNSDRVETPVTPKTDLAIDKSDSPDPVEPGQTFSYKLRVVNNGPSIATGVAVVDVLPPQVTFLTASHANLGDAGQLEFDLGTLVAGASVEISIQVTVDQGFVGTLLNHAQVSGLEVETNYDNNDDSETTLVKVNPASLGGVVYVDKDNDGVRDATEKPIANVIVTLTGNDLTGAAVILSTVTDAAGRYEFKDVMPGTYHVKQSHPQKYRDGKDTLGNTYNAAGELTSPNGFLALDTNAEDDFDADAFQGIVLGGGFIAQDYNFGEQAVSTNKRDFVRPMVWR